MIKRKNVMDMAGKRTWRIVYQNGTVATVKADTYSACVERADRMSYIKIRDVVLIGEAQP